MSRITHDNQGSSRITTVELRQYPGVSRTYYGFTTDIPGKPRTELSPRTTMDHPGNVKQFKTAGARCRIITDHTGSPRTHYRPGSVYLDHHGPRTAAYPDHHGPSNIPSDPGLWCDHSFIDIQCVCDLVWRPIVVSRPNSVGTLDFVGCLIVYVPFLARICIVVLSVSLLRL